MKVLVIGSGAREHALAWKLAAERRVTEVLCTPGNPGIAAVARLAPGTDLSPEALVAVARSEAIDLTVVGPEAPLAAGVADRFREAGLHLLGPTRAAARLETSKVFAKEFMRRHRVPTARYHVVETPEAGRAAIDDLGVPVVVKADGLAAGKGVVVASDRAAAEQAVDAAMIARQFGDAGARLVVEECLSGPEVSFFVLCDGERAMVLGSAQDHKRAYDDDRGPNTGGMGAFAPSPLMTHAVEERVLREIVGPVLAGMRAEGAPYRGFLYVGLMLTADGPRVIEFNVRFGDPEAQVVLPLMADDLAPLLAEAASGWMAVGRCRFLPQRHVGVVLASGGYPGPFETGKPVEGVEEAAAHPGTLVFHAGTAHRDGRLVTAGGRVLTVVGQGHDFETAIERAYAAAGRIRFDGLHLRRDIGRAALAPPAPSTPRPYR